MSEASPTRPTGRLSPTLSYRSSRSFALMFCQRFVRTRPGDTALTRIGASSIARARVRASMVPRTLARDSGCEDDRSPLADMWASVFDRGECGPIAQFKSAPGLLEIRRCEFLQLQAIAGGEY